MPFSANWDIFNSFFVEKHVYIWHIKSQWCILIFWTVNDPSPIHFQLNSNSCNSPFNSWSRQMSCLLNFYCGGCVEVSIMHPLDVVKTRLQIQKTPPPGTLVTGTRQIHPVPDWSKFPIYRQQRVLQGNLFDPTVRPNRRKRKRAGGREP
jgi:hypothetical protein